MNLLRALARFWPQPTRLPARKRPTVPPGIFFTERPPAGIAFTERMSGWWSPAAPGRGEPKRRDYERAVEQGRLAGRSLEVVITIAADNLTTMLGRLPHEARFAGSAALAGVPGAAAPTDLLVTDGTFQLFVEDPRVIASRKMAYAASLTAPDGRTWRLEGFKAIRYGGGIQGFLHGDDPTSLLALWADQTRLFFTLREEAGGRRGLGILSVSAGDFLRQLRTIRSLGAESLAERFDTVMRFLVFFGGVLRDTYGGPFARSRYAPPNWWRRPRRPLHAHVDRPVASVLDPPARDRLQWREVPVTTEDGAELLLTCYRLRDEPQRSRRPVILAPGFGVRADSFAIDTVDPNLVEFLCAKGYQVWLFDYRASPQLPASREQFSLDRIAEVDWPTAVRTVRDLTGSASVDAIVHCVGAMTFMMSALRGKLRDREGSWIGSAVCSQVGAHPIGSHLNELKAVSGLGYWLQLLFGVKALRVTVQAQDTYHQPPLDRILKLYPTDDPCDNPVCRRIKFVFGESYLHANLTPATHDAVIEMFGNPGGSTRFGDPAAGKAASVSLRALRHLALIIHEGRLLTEDGEDTYLTREGLANLDFRLCLVSGAKNQIFPPIGIEMTHAWLTRALPPERRDLVAFRSFAGYAHMDCFIGDNAHADVFPEICAWLAGSAGGAEA